jgi:hypothetical protein
VTRYNLPLADDSSSIESFLRVRRSQLPGGRPPIRGTREAAERRSAEHDAERIVDLLHRMPVEEFVPRSRRSRGLRLRSPSFEATGSA